MGIPRWLVPAGLVLAVAGGAVACGGTVDEADASGRLRVVATTPVVADFATVVGGEAVTVYAVIKANVDPHDFEPSPADLEALRRADVIVKNGVGLEEWFDEVLESADAEGTIVDASTGIEVRRARGEDDPHIWHDPRNAIRMVTTIVEAFAGADPAREADYRRRGEEYVATLRSLDDEIQRQVDSLASKKLVTNHDAFGYYVSRYGFEFIGSVIPSFDTSAELSARDIDDLVAKIRATGTRAVFSEGSLPARTAQSIGREAGVRVVAGEDALYGDSLGPDGSPAATYVDLMRHNTKVIVDNLR